MVTLVQNKTIECFGEVVNKPMNGRLVFPEDGGIITIPTNMQKRIEPLTE